MQKYIEHLDKILMIQDYLEELAVKNNVKIIQNYNLDNTVKEALELIFQTVKDQFANLGDEYTKGY
jgi:2-phosphoglycerate kinase